MLSVNIHYSSYGRASNNKLFRMCVRPCPCYLTGGDTHILCVACLGEEHVQSAVESTTICLGTLQSRLAFFRKDAQARIPQGSGPAAAEAQRRLLSAEVETGTALISTFT